MGTAIGKIESDHGRFTAPGVLSGSDGAGVAGPMQFGVGGRAGDTWSAYGVDGDGDGRAIGAWPGSGQSGWTWCYLQCSSRLRSLVTP